MNQGKGRYHSQPITSKHLTQIDYPHSSSFYSANRAACDWAHKTWQLWSSLSSLENTKPKLSGNKLNSAQNDSFHLQYCYHQVINSCYQGIHEVQHTHFRYGDVLQFLYFIPLIIKLNKLETNLPGMLASLKSVSTYLTGVLWPSCWQLFHSLLSLHVLSSASPHTPGKLTAPGITVRSRVIKPSK